MDDNSIRVTVYCLTYNHEKHIRKALESFVMQKTNFKYKVVVHDDASTDNTAKIVEEFERNYPDIIFPIYQKENQYSKSINIFTTFIRPLIEGDYIAICEGDDYWIDEYKLQKQVDALDTHQEIDMCVHGSLNHDVTNDTFWPNRFNKDINYIISQRKAISAGGGLVATNSILYRKKLAFDIPNFREIYRIDYTLQIAGSLRGGLLYLKDIMSVYNQGVRGSATERIFNDCKKCSDHFLRLFSALNMLNKETHYKYFFTIKIRILQMKKRHIQKYGLQTIKKENINFYNNIGLFSLTLIYLLIFITTTKDKIINSLK